MPARVFQFSDFTPKPGEYSLLITDLPGHGVNTVGVVLHDPAADVLYARLRRDLHRVASDEDIEVITELAHDLTSKAEEYGGNAVLEQLEAAASMSIRISDREAVTVRGFERTLNELYREHVPVEVQEYRTHLPLMTMAAAAGLFLNNDEVSVEEWMEMPEDLRLDPDMFVARIQGHSMEPRIPDGSLCVFKGNVVGSRLNKLVLVRKSELGSEHQFSVKRYKSEKRYSEESFEHTRIRLESLNPAYPSWDLDMDEATHNIVGEFIRVLE